jgi:hypothetical protein
MKLECYDYACCKLKHAHAHTHTLYSSITDLVLAHYVQNLRRALLFIFAEILLRETYAPNLCAQNTRMLL